MLLCSASRPLDVPLRPPLVVLTNCLGPWRMAHYISHTDMRRGPPHYRPMGLWWFDTNANSNESSLLVRVMIWLADPPVVALRGPAYIKTASPTNYQYQWNNDAILDCSQSKAIYNNGVEAYDVLQGAELSLVKYHMLQLYVWFW